MKTFYLILCLLALSLTSCRSKKTLTEDSQQTRIDTVVKVEKVVDTIFRDRIIEKTKPVYSEIIIEKPCDSLGNLLPVNYNIGSGGNSSRVFTKDGKLYISQKLDSIENRYENEYRARWVKDSTALHHSLISEQSSKKEVVRYVYPWWVWALIVAIVLRVLFWLYIKFSIKPL